MTSHPADRHIAQQTLENTRRLASLSCLHEAVTLILENNPELRGRLMSWSELERVLEELRTL